LLSAFERQQTQYRLSDDMILTIRRWIPNFIGFKVFEGDNTVAKALVLRSVLEKADDTQESEASILETKKGGGPRSFQALL
jgi:hypothetical protein